MKETKIQSDLFKWISIKANSNPLYQMIYANGNESGKVNPIFRFKRAREGVKKGIPDITIPIAKHGFHGAYIEVKTKKGTPSKDQIWWIEQLQEQGYFAKIIKTNNWCEISDLITWYLEK